MNKKRKMTTKLLAKVLVLLGTIFIALQLGSVCFASEGYKVSGYVKPEFLYDLNAESEIISDFKVEIAELPNASANTYSTGYFEITGVPENPTGYTLKISKSAYLQRIVKGVIVKGDLQINPPSKPLELWAGDIAPDGTQDSVINILDIMGIAQVFNVASTDNRYNRDLDFNKDNSINMKDIMIVVAHFNTSSDSYTAYAINPFPVGAFAVNSKTVEVTFNMKIETGISKDKFSIEGLDITDAFVKDDGTGQVMVLKTISQSAGIIYAVTYEDIKIHFGGVGIPSLEDYKISGLWANYLSGDRTSVKVSWIPMNDYAINVTEAKGYEIYYSIAGSNNPSSVTVNDIKSCSTQINGLDPGKNYMFAICVRNESIKSALTDYITATTDTSIPKLLSVTSKSNTEVSLTFDEEMDKTKAEDISNYTISGLTVSNAQLDPSAKVITLTTSVQVPGQIYNITVSNLTDKNGNLMESGYVKSVFTAYSGLDNTKPRLEYVISKNNTQVIAVFNEKMDKISAENISNYSIAGLSVLNAKLDPDANAVTLTTTSQTAGTIYKLTASNVTDISGNIVDADYDEFQFGGIPPDTNKPYLTYAKAIDSTTVKVNFSEPMDETLASSTYCYYLGPELGYPTSVIKGSEFPDGMTWILTTKPQAAKVYKLIVSDVTDTSGNVIDPERNEFPFPGIDTPDTVNPSISAATAINNNTVKIMFSEALKRSSIKADAFTFSLYSGIDNSPAGITDNGAHPDSILVSDDNKSVTVNFTDRHMAAGAVYKVTADNTLQDEAGNTITTDNSALFAGIQTENPAPKINLITAINNQTLKITFNKPITLTSGLVETDFEFSPAFTAVVNKCVLSSDKTNIMLYFTGAGESDKLAPGVYTVSLNTSGKSKIKDEFGTQAFSANEDDAKGIFAGISQGATSPKISSVVSIDNNTLDIMFDQEVDKKSVESLSNADFTFENSSGSSVTAIVALVRFEGDSGNKIRVFLSSMEYDPLQVFKPGTVYKLIINSEKIVNMNGLVMQAADNNRLFAAISTQNAPPKIENAYKVNSTHMKVVFSEKITGLQADGSDFIINTALTGSTITGAIVSAAIDTTDASGKTVILTLSEGSLSPGINTVSIAQHGIKDEAGVGDVDIYSKADFAY